jgi:hypothetical protein
MGDLDRLADASQRRQRDLVVALAGGLITPGEAQAIARVFTTFVQTIEISDFDQRLQVLETRQAEDRPTQPRPWPLSSLAT